MQYKEAKGDFWKPAKEGDFVEGLFIKKEENVGENKSNIYHVEKLDTHDIVRFWGTAILDQRMSEVRVGSQVRITYKGLGPKGKGGKQPHIWKVEYGEPDVNDLAKFAES